MTTRPAQSSRRLLGPAIACLLFILLVLPCKYTLLYLTREGLRLASTIGLMDESNGLGGQILGYNYFRRPIWVHWLSGFLAAALALGIPFICCLLLARRIGSGRGHPTLCGICGTNIDKRGGCVMTPQGLQCPECKNTFADFNRANSKAGEPPPIPIFMLTRHLASILTIGAAHVFLDRVMTVSFQNAILQLGEATGSQVFRISGLVGLGANGPFHTQDAASAFWNTMYRYGPTYANVVFSALIALATYRIVSGPFGRTRIFGYRGRTRCGGCNYDLADLKSERCPECGKVLAQTHAAAFDTFQ